MSNQFGGPSASQSFLVGLASSTMDAFKADHDRERKEDADAKAIDYDLLMKALKTVQDDDNLTPTQRTAATQEIMQRSIDIFKPKGHGGIKDNLKKLFGGGERYQPQGVGDLLTKQRPRADVAAPVTQPDGGGSTRLRTVTMPPPPVREQTFREMDQADKLEGIDAVTERQLAVEEAKALNQKRQREIDNKEIRDRYREQFQLRDEALVSRKFRERAYQLNPLDPDDPATQQRVAQMFADEAVDKKRLVEARIQLAQTRVKGIVADIEAAKERIKLMGQGLSLRQQKAWDDDTQVKAAWSKVQDQGNLANKYYAEMAAAHGRYAASNFHDEGAKIEAETYLQRAQEAELEWQKTVNSIQLQREQKMQRSSGVTLPNPPTTGSRRSGVRLTEAEIRAAGGGDAAVKRARERGQLAP